jgi:hypothetical protein
MIQQTQGNAALEQFQEQVLHGLELLQTEVGVAGSEVEWFRQTLGDSDTVGVFYDRLTCRLEYRQQEGIPELLTSGRYIMLTKINRWHAFHLYTPFDDLGNPVSRNLPPNSVAELHRDWLEVLYVKAKEDVIATLVMSCVIPADVAKGLGLDLVAAVKQLVRVHNLNVKNAYVKSFGHGYSRDYLNLASELTRSALSPLLEDGVDLQAVNHELDEVYGLYILHKLRRVIRCLQLDGVSVANGDRLIELIDGMP